MFLPLRGTRAVLVPDTTVPSDREAETVPEVLTPPLSVPVRTEVTGPLETLDRTTEMGRTPPPPLALAEEPLPVCPESATETCPVVTTETTRTIAVTNVGRKASRKRMVLAPLQLAGRDECNNRQDDAQGT
jgi:hypothetical protein